MPRYEIIEAPSVLGLFPRGVERAPQALLDAGLALATGRGPRLVADIEGRGPLVSDDDVALLGCRVFADGTDRNRAAHVGDTAILVRDLTDIRRAGLDAALAPALARVARDGLEGFFIHLDAGVLSDAIMPAVHYRAPDGLLYEEVADILRAALDTGKAVGLELTIFNPSLDADGSLAARLVQMLADGLNTGDGWGGVAPRP